MKLEVELKAKLGARRFQLFLGETPKQQLITLQKAGYLTPLQAKACARRMDAMTAGGRVDPKEAMAQTIGELKSGQLRVGAPDPKAPANQLKLAALREQKPGLSKAQELLELRNAGSLSPNQTRDAAQYVHAKKCSVEEALVHVGAQALLETLPPADPEGGEETDTDTPPPEGTGEGDGSDGDPDEDGDEDDDDEDDDVSVEERDAAAAKQATTLGGLLEGNEEEVKAGLEKINAKPAVIQLYLLEQQGKKRKGVSSDILKRGEELGVTPDEFNEAIHVHNAVHAPAAKPDEDDTKPTVDAYSKHIEGEAPSGE